MADLPLGWIALPGYGEREDSAVRVSDIIRVSGYAQGGAHIHMSSGAGFYVAVGQDEVMQRIADEHARPLRERWVGVRYVAGAAEYFTGDRDGEWSGDIEEAQTYTARERWDEYGLPPGADRWLKIRG